MTMTIKHDAVLSKNFPAFPATEFAAFRATVTSLLDASPIPAESMTQLHDELVAVLVAYSDRAKYGKLALALTAHLILLPKLKAPQAHNLMVAAAEEVISKIELPDPTAIPTIKSALVPMPIAIDRYVERLLELYEDAADPDDDDEDDETTASAPKKPAKSKFTASKVADTGKTKQTPAEARAIREQQQAEQAENEAARKKFLTQRPVEQTKGHIVHYTHDLASLSSGASCKVNNTAIYNKNFAMIAEGSGVVIAVMQGFDSKRPSGLPVVWAQASFHTNMKHDYYTIETKDGPVKVPAAPSWVNDKSRTWYSGFCFEPDSQISTGSMLNLFTGFPTMNKTVETDFDGCKLLLGHIRNNLCDGDDAVYRWVMTWIADIFQNPADKKGTAIAVRGHFGVGKSWVSSCIKECLGYLATKVAGGARLESNFNADFAARLFCQVEEMGWNSKDKADILKDMITDPVLTIENKHRDAYKIVFPMRFFSPAIATVLFQLTKAIAVTSFYRLVTLVFRSTMTMACQR